jgi:hypothetical protein
MNTNIRNETTEGKTKREKRKTNQLRLFTFKHKLLKISAYLQTAFATETHLAEGQ